MEAFTDLHSLYEHVERHAMSYEYLHNIVDLFRKIRDKKNEEKDIEQATMAQWEMDFLNFTATAGEIKSMWTMTTDKGENVEYPNFKEFTEAKYDYLVQRFDGTSDPRLKAQYAHVLWGSPVRHHAKYAKSAIDSYLSLLKAYEVIDRERPDSHYGLYICEILENVYVLACKVSYRIDDVKAEIRRLIQTFNSKSTSRFALASNLIRLMLREKSHFSASDFSGIADVCQRFAEELKSVDNFHFAITMLEMGDTVDKRAGTRTHDWRRQIAEYYEMLMKHAEPDPNMATIMFCQRALAEYKALGDKEKVKELEQKYIQLREVQQFQEYSVEVPIDNIQKNHEKLADEIIGKGPDHLLAFLVGDSGLLPKYDQLKEIAASQDREFIYRQLFAPMVVDQSGNIAQHFTSDDEKRYYGILENYSQVMQFRVLFLRILITKAMEKGTLSYDVVRKWLQEESWLGMPFSVQIANELHERVWFPLIEPGLRNYFSQMESCLENRDFKPNWILAIDSLTPKIEGIVRDFCGINGAATSYVTRDKKNRDISRQKDIEMLLREDILRKYLNEDELLFLKFLLVEKAGLNLRHKVAHALLYADEYGIAYAHLLLVALLRLGKFVITPRKPDAGETASPQP